MVRPGVLSLCLGHSSNRSTAHHQRNSGDSLDDFERLMHNLSEDQGSAHCVSLGVDVWMWAGGWYTRADHRGTTDNAGGIAGQRVHQDKQTNKTLPPPSPPRALLCLVLPSAAADAPSRESGVCFYLESNFFQMAHAPGRWGVDVRYVRNSLGANLTMNGMRLARRKDENAMRRQGRTGCFVSCVVSDDCLMMHGAAAATTKCGHDAELEVRTGRTCKL